MKTLSQRRNGFTLVEMTIASGLTVLLAFTISSVWLAFARPTSSLIAAGRLFQEMDIAVATLARDLGGSLPDYQDANPVAPPLGGKADGCLVTCQQYPPGPDPGTHLQLWFSSGSIAHAGWLQPVADGAVVDYYVDTASHTLVRSNQTPPGTIVPRNFIVAGNVDSMAVDNDPNDGNNLRIQLTFSYSPGNSATLTRTCILVTRKTP